MRRLAGRRWGDTSYMVGAWSWIHKDGDLEKWRPAKDIITATINFAIATGRLEDRRSREDDWDENGDSESEG